jgi:hypothetical protein
MACLAVRLLGLPAKQAVYWVRQSVPGALENEAQVDFIERFSEEFNHQDTETPRFFFMPW